MSVLASPHVAEEKARAEAKARAEEKAGVEAKARGADGTLRVAHEALRVITLPADGRSKKPRSATVRMSMYFAPDGTLHHARCRKPLQFRGVRAEVEGDFWCLACHEHVTIPYYALPDIPVDAAVETERPALLRLVR